MMCVLHNNYISLAQLVLRKVSRPLASCEELGSYQEPSLCRLVLLYHQVMEFIMALSSELLTTGYGLSGSTVGAPMCMV